MCPEAPVPIFQPVSQKENGGMARNVKNNLVALGADVHIISNDNGMKKVRYVDTNSNQMIMRLDENDVCGRIENLRDMSFSDYDAIVISDYDKGFLHVDDIQYICEKYEDVFIDTKKEMKNYFGLSGLKICAKATKIPLIAIGGINISDVNSILKLKIHGVAMISSLLKGNIKKNCMDVSKIISSYEKI